MLIWSVLAMLSKDNKYPENNRPGGKIKSIISLSFFSASKIVMEWFSNIVHKKRTRRRQSGANRIVYYREPVTYWVG